MLLSDPAARSPCHHRAGIFKTEEACKAAIAASVRRNSMKLRGRNMSGYRRFICVKRWAPKPSTICNVEKAATFSSGGRFLWARLIYTCPYGRQRTCCRRDRGNRRHRVSPRRPARPRPCLKAQRLRMHRRHSRANRQPARPSCRAKIRLVAVMRPSRRASGTHSTSRQNGRGPTWRASHRSRRAGRRKSAGLVEIVRPDHYISIIRLSLVLLVAQKKDGHGCFHRDRPCFDQPARCRPNSLDENGTFGWCLRRRHEPSGAGASSIRRRSNCSAAPVRCRTSASSSPSPPHARP